MKKHISNIFIAIISIAGLLYLYREDFTQGIFTYILYLATFICSRILVHQTKNAEANNTKPSPKVMILLGLVTGALGLGLAVIILRFIFVS